MPFFTQTDIDLVRQTAVEIPNIRAVFGATPQVYLTYPFDITTRNIGNHRPSATYLYNKNRNISTYQKFSKLDSDELALSERRQVAQEMMSLVLEQQKSALISAGWQFRGHTYEGLKFSCPASFSSAPEPVAPPIPNATMDIQNANAEDKWDVLITATIDEAATFTIGTSQRINPQNNAQQIQQTTRELARITQNRAWDHWKITIEPATRICENPIIYTYKITITEIDITKTQVQRLLGYVGQHQYCLQEICFDRDNILGRGGFGMVAKVKLDKQDRQFYGFKVAPYINDMIDRVLRNEIASLRSFNHPNIVQFRESFVGYFRLEPSWMVDWYQPVPPQQYQLVAGILMDFVAGQNVETRIRTREPMQGRPGFKILLGVAHALKYLESLQSAHRDISANNIMVKEDGTPMLIDFSLVRQTAVEQDDNEQRPRTIISRRIGVGINGEQVEETVGTCQYLAPEIFLSKDVECRRSIKLDMYSLGVLYYRMLLYTFPEMHTDPTRPILVREMANRLGIIRQVLLDNPNQIFSNPDQYYGWLTRLTDHEPVYATEDGKKSLKILKGLLHPDPAQRWTPQRLIDELESNRGDVEWFVQGSGEKIAGYMTPTFHTDIPIYPATQNIIVKTRELTPAELNHIQHADVEHPGIIQVKERPENEVWIANSNIVGNQFLSFPTDTSEHMEASIAYCRQITSFKFAKLPNLPRFQVHTLSIAIMDQNNVILENIEGRRNPNGIGAVDADFTCNSLSNSLRDPVGKKIRFYVTLVLRNADCVPLYRRSCVGIGNPCTPIGHETWNIPNYNHNTLMKAQNQEHQNLEKPDEESCLKVVWDVDPNPARHDVSQGLNYHLEIPCLHLPNPIQICIKCNVVSGDKLRTLMAATQLFVYEQEPHFLVFGLWPNSPTVLYVCHTAQSNIAYADPMQNYYSIMYEFVPGTLARNRDNQQIIEPQNANQTDFIESPAQWPIDFFVKVLDHLHHNITNCAAGFGREGRWTGNIPPGNWFSEEILRERLAQIHVPDRHPESKKIPILVENITVPGTNQRTWKLSYLMSPQEQKYLVTICADQVQ